MSLMPPADHATSAMNQSDEPVSSQRPLLGFDFPLEPAPSRPANEKSLVMHPEDFRHLRELTTDCAKDVFGGYGIQLELDPAEDTSRMSGAAPLVSFIGFGGDTLRGTLIVVAPFEVIRSSYPAELKETAEAALQMFDWAGEITNQILGRIKNRLLPRGVEIVVSMPKVMLAQHFRVPSSSRGAVCELRFRAGGHSVGVWLDAMANNSSQALIGPPQTLPSGEGDVLLF